MNLKTINFSEDSQLRSIGNNSFSYSSIELLNLPPLIESICKFSFYCRKYSQIEKIEKYSFAYSSLKNISFPSSLFSQFAFYMCEKLEFPNDSKLQVIKDQSFESSSIQKIYFPSCLKSICNKAFSRN